MSTLDGQIFVLSPHLSTIFLQLPTLSYSIAWIHQSIIAQTIYIQKGISPEPSIRPSDKISSQLNCCVQNKKNEETLNTRLL